MESRLAWIIGCALSVAVTIGAWVVWPALGALLVVIWVLAALAAGLVVLRRKLESPWWVDAIAGAAGAAAGVLLLLYIVGSWYTGHWGLGRVRSGLPWDDFLKVATPGVALIVAVVAAVLAGHGHTTRLAEHQTDRARYEVDSYTKAVDQLGNDQVSVRLGGIYALERLALAVPTFAPVVDQVLCAHVRLILERLVLDEQAEAFYPGGTAMALTPWNGREGEEKPSASRAEVQAALRVLANLQQDFDLSLTTWPRQMPPGLTLNGANLRAATLQSTQLVQARLERAKLSGANLVGVNLDSAKLFGAELGDGAELVGANLSLADLSGAKMFGADLGEAELPLANLSGADLSGARFNGANLSGANLSEADLYGADLSGARFNGANLSGANLSEADLSGANLAVANLEGARLDGAEGLKNNDH